MRFISFVASVAIAALTASVVYVGSASGEANGKAQSFVKVIPHGYRDWRFISLAREEAPLDDIRVILGNDTAIKAYRDGTRSFPDGSIVARLAYGYDASAENDKIFGRRQSFVAGHPKNGLQFMLKDAKKYAATGGWGYAQFDDGKPADDAKMKTCFPCHYGIASRDFVFTRYAP
jgi:Cytochrome P460